MWTKGILVVLWLAAAACKTKGDASAEPDPAALKAQQELLARRDNLMAQRLKLQGERDQVDLQIKQAQSAGSDTSVLAKQRADLDSQIEGQTSELITTLSSKIESLHVAGDAAAGIASREASMGSREKTVATREAQIAERERALAGREATLAQREKETCGATQPMIIQQVAAPKGSNYARKDIEPLLGRARATMAKKGLLVSDLPGQAQGLENEATKAMADNDWGRAYLAATQLSATVDAVKIDRTFITQKYARVNARVSSTKQDDATTQQLTEGMKDVLQKYGDGDFVSANRKLDQLISLMR